MIEQKKTYVACIGTSGNDPSDQKKLEPKHFEYGMKMISEYIDSMGLDPFDIVLVSGGSAWFDHIAIQLYLNGGFGGLELYLPSIFDHKQKKYVNTHEGRKLNDLHSKFMEKVKYINPFEDLTKIAHRCPKYGIRIEIKRGFKQRNTLIAKRADHLIAFTFGTESKPISPGTLDTWNKAHNAKKIHQSLSLA